MQKSIENFIKTTEYGLYLIDMPTGTGKTTQAIEYIFEHYNEKRNFFYITSLKKNIDDAYNDLYILFKNANKESIFKSNVLRIYSNSEKVIEKIEGIPYNSKDEIMHFESFKILKREVESLNKLGNIDPVFKEKLQNEIKEKLEPNFRKDVKSYLNEKKQTKKERLKYIKDNHDWLIELYPSILTNYRKIFFLTIDKFYLGNDTIIESPYKFINNLALLKNSVFFIDEIDATKNTILNRQIEEGLKNNVDLIQLFLNIHSALNTKVFPKEMLIPSQTDIAKGRNEIGIIDKMKTVFNDAFKNNNMQYAYKLLEKDNDRKYIFDDNSILTITNRANVHEMYIKSSNTENYNRILLKNEGNLQSLHSVIRNVCGAITYFINGCYVLSVNYCKSYNENKKEHEDIMQIDDATSSIIRAFNISDKYLNYLSNAILNKGYNKFNNIGGISTDIYDVGFKYYKFNDSINNNFTTVISMYDLNDTPENFIYNLCKKVHAIGLSATSTIETVTGNFDLNFLKNNLGRNYYNSSMEEKLRIDTEINKIIDSNKSKINVEVEKSDDPVDTLNILFQTQDYIKFVLNLLGNINDKNDRYNANRFLKIATAIKKFILQGLPSLLILGNRNLRDSNGLYSLETFRKLVEFIQNDCNNKDKYEIINLTSLNFEEHKKKYLAALDNKSKVIIFSSYPTTGAGQNLQYSFEEDGEIKKQDLSSIYVEKPTNMLVNTSNFNETTSNDLLKYIYQVEALKSNGEITLKDKDICIKEGFLRTHNKDSYRKHENLYKCNSIKNHALSVIIQAIGRICRTRGKQADTAIYVDYDIFNELDVLSVGSRRLNKEFMEIVKTAEQLKINKLNNLPYFLSLRKAENNNKIINDNIKRILAKKSWSDDDIQLWKDLREQFLKYPMVNDIDLMGRFVNCYLDSPDYNINYYFYKEENDYGSVRISLKENKDFPTTVSFESCKLDKLMSVPLLRDYFIKNEYAISFQKSKYIMLPIIFNNIYKGALGEVVGKLILEKMGYPLEDINDPLKFEKFDYVYKDIYFDFKFWGNNGEKLDIEYIAEKTQKVNAKFSFVINVLGNNTEETKHYGNVYVIPSLMDINTLEISPKAYELLRKVLGGKDGRGN